MNIARLLKGREPLGGGPSAILGLERRPLGYARLFEHCSATIALLNGAGISRGDRVAVVLPNGPEMATCFLAVTMGASCAPLNPTYRRSEFEFYFSDLAPRALIVQDGIESPAIEVAQAHGIRIIRLQPSTDQEAGIFSLDFGGRITAAAPEFAQDGDEALVLHTSGTTARPKMVPLTQANLTASAANIAASLELGSSDRCLNVMPLFHIHGLVGALLATMSAGGSIVCTPGFQAPRFLDWCKEFAPTWYTAVPTMHQAVLARARQNDRPRANPKLRFIRSCSAALAPQLMAEMERTFHVPAIEAYGMTEASHQIATNPGPPGVRKPGSVGIAAGAEVALMDEAGNLLGPGETGEIVLRGPGVTAGYAENPEANRTSFTNGWFRTGDQGKVDADGYLFITGRLKEIINRGGQKISPREIDEVLSTHPAVAQAVAFAVPDHRLGEQVAAAVVLRPGYGASEIEIRNHAANLIADYKVPHRIVFLDELPKGPTGKLQRIGLAAQLGLDNNASDAGSNSESRPSEYLAPRTPTERMLADIWRQVLRVERVGVQDDFLMLGGDSILAALVTARVRESGVPGLSLLTFFEHPTIARLAEAIDTGGEDWTHSSDPIVAASVSGELPLSSAQRRMWFLAELDENSTAYNRSNLFRIRGKLEPRALENALEEIVARHAILRTSFHSRDGTPVQLVSPPGPVAVAHLDLSDPPEANRIERALAAVIEAANRKFDLTRDPMLRPLLVKLDADDYLLALTMHHIAADGWSAGVLMRELSALYAARAADNGGAADPPALKPLAVQYSDFARWQSEAAGGAQMRESLAWWKKQLAGAPPLLALPSGRPRPPRQTFPGAAETFVIPKELTDRLKEIARGERATLFMTLLAAFETLIHRYTGLDDMVVGAFVAARTRVEIEGLIGLFSNMLAMRGNLAGDPTFRELLISTRDFAFKAYAHQDLPFDMIVESIQPQRNPSYPAIVQVTFQVRNYPLEDAQLAGLEVTEVDFDPGVTPFDLSFEVTERAGGLFCKLIYNVDLFDRETISRMAGHFETLLGRVVEDPETPISRLPLLTAGERRQLLVEWNDTRRDYPHECIHRLFEAQVERTPDVIAATFGASQMTYAELNGRANQLAHALIGAGVTPRSIVAICIDRSLSMMVSLLGILKAGAAYMPIDPSFPRERLDFMLEDCAAPVVTTTTSLAQKFAASRVRVVCIDEDLHAANDRDAGNPQVRVTAEDDAYVLYTSGSTGKPKGVPVSHRSFSNLLNAMRDEISFTSDDVLLAVTTLSFDIAGLELFLPLICGGRLALGDEYAADGERLIEDIAATRPTVMQTAPALWRGLVAAGWRGDPKLRIISGGEALTRTLAEQLLDRVGVVFNGYGPTETTIYSTVHRVERGSGPVPIGHPVANTQVYVLDDARQPLPAGAVGELYIGGDGVARGYIGRPELTAERFVADPFASVAGRCLYRTGDTVRRLPNGDVEYIGRADNQLKVLGIRIEPGEIEAALTRHPQVQAAAVTGLVDASETKLLVAFVEARPGHLPTAATLREFLSESMPVYMIPTRYVFVDRLALTHSGKIDRAKLPPLDESLVQTEQKYVEPRDDIERRLQTIWEEILNLRPIGVRHEFFALGGNSLNAVRVLSRIEREFDFRVPLAAMFPAPTIESMAVRIRGDSAHSVRNATVPIQPHGLLPPLFVVGNFQVFKDLGQYLGHDQPMIGVTVPDELKMRLPYKLEELAASQVASILDYQDAGPYFIAGFSAEGVLAYEVAQQLRAKGREVGLLVMIDTSCPLQPQESWAARVEKDLKNFQNKLRGEGINSAWISMSRRARRLAIRIRIIKWRIGNRIGVEFKQPAPARPDDFFTAIVRASRRYVPQPYGGPVLLFKRTGDRTGRFSAKNFGWSEALVGRLETFDIEGQHWTLLTQPGVGALAKKLDAALRKARESAARIDSSEWRQPAHTIALPQIEERLTKHPGVRQAVVTASRHASGEQKLVAYVVPDKDYLHSVAANEGERLEDWRAVFDWFQEEEGSSSTGFNTLVWNSSYTREPVPADEMREWVDTTVEEILSLHPAEILEIGCGTGLLLLRIAPTSKRYVGMDFSATSLKSLREQMAAFNGVSRAVTLLERQADNFEDLDDNSFDTIIINSVVQYFPSLEHLTRVLEGTLKAAKPRSAIFIGDVRSLSMLEAWSASVELFQAPSTLSLSDLREKIRRRVNQERELVISPAFFFALQRRYPQISRIEIRPKWGSADNEMNSFRYNVTLFLDPHEQKYIEPRWLDWTAEGLTLDAIGDLLRSGTEMIAIKGVVNVRVEKDVEALARLANSDDSSTAGELREALGNTPTSGVSPDKLRSLAKQFDYQAQISWASCRSDGSFDVFFRRLAAGEELTSVAVAWPRPDTVDEDLAAHVHDPSRIARRRMLIQQLRDYAKASLPGPMVPAEFVLVDAIPLTSDGAIDRTALPASEIEPVGRSDNGIDTSAAAG
jgi:amino acid adenylation domain-containing protein